MERSGAFRSSHRAALDLVGAYCDLEDRLDYVPATARVRGIAIRAIASELEKQKPSALAEFKGFFPHDDFSSIPHYPLPEYLIRLAVAGALVATPARVHEGMFEISRGHASAFADSILGRTLIRLLARDPVKLIEQGVAMRRQMATFGHWSVVRHGDQQIEVVHEDEYVWLESAIAGSAVGTFQARGLTVTMEKRLSDRFNGSLIFSW